MPLTIQQPTDGALQIIGAVVIGVLDGSGNLQQSLPVTTTGAQRTPTATARTTNGSVTAGCRGLTFIADATFAGTVLGMPLLAGASLTIPVQPGDTLAAVAYTVTAGNLYSVEVR